MMELQNILKKIVQSNNTIFLQHTFYKKKYSCLIAIKTAEKKLILGPCRYLALQGPKISFLINIFNK